VSAIGISPQDDNFRMVGLTNGKISGRRPARSADRHNGAGMPAKYVGRMVFDPTNKNTAYVSFNGYGVTAGRTFGKQRISTGHPRHGIAAGNGIPDVPVNALAVDPQLKQCLRGHGLGVYASTDGGRTGPHLNGASRSSRLDMAFRIRNRIFAPSPRTDAACGR